MEIAIVTGAASGVGLAVARKLVDLGYRVYGLGGNYQDTAFSHRDFLPTPCDLSSIADIQQKVQQVIDEGNDVSLVVNNAKYFSAHPFREMQLNEIEATIAINLICPLAVVRMALPSLAKFKGHIINIAPTNVSQSRGGPAAAAAAGGLDWMGEALFEELRDNGVKVTTLYPQGNRIRPTDAGTPAQGRPPKSAINPESIAEAIEHIVVSRNGNFISQVILRPEQLREDSFPPAQRLPMPKPKMEYPRIKEPASEEVRAAEAAERHAGRQKARDEERRQRRDEEERSFREKMLSQSSELAREEAEEGPVNAPDAQVGWSEDEDFDDEDLPPLMPERQERRDREQQDRTQRRDQRNPQQQGQRGDRRDQRQQQQQARGQQQGQRDGRQQGQPQGQQQQGQRGDRRDQRQQQQQGQRGGRPQDQVRPEQGREEGIPATTAEGHLAAPAPEATLPTPAPTTPSIQPEAVPAAGAHAATPAAPEAHRPHSRRQELFIRKEPAGKLPGAEKTGGSFRPQGGIMKQALPSANLGGLQSRMRQQRRGALRPTEAQPSATPAPEPQRALQQPAQAPAEPIPAPATPAPEPAAKPKAAAPAPTKAPAQPAAEGEIPAAGKPKARKPAARKPKPTKAEADAADATPETADTGKPKTRKPAARKPKAIKESPEQPTLPEA